MTRRMISAGAAALLVGFAAQSAHAWTPEGTVTTQRGTYSVSGSGSCAYGTCSRSQSIVGPNGYSVSRSGSVSRLGPRHYSYSRSVTGPYGGTAIRSGTVWR